MKKIEIDKDKVSLRLIWAAKNALKKFKEYVEEDLIEKKELELDDIKEILWKKYPRIKIWESSDKFLEFEMDQEIKGVRIEFDGVITDYGILIDPTKIMISENNICYFINLKEWKGGGRPEEEELKEILQDFANLYPQIQFKLWKEKGYWKIRYDVDDSVEEDNELWDSLTELSDNMDKEYWILAPLFSHHDDTFPSPSSGYLTITPEI